VKRLIHLERNQRHRLLNEARSTVKLGGHQNIVQVYDVVEEGDEALLVMEYVDGETLERICARQIREGIWLEYEDALEYFRQILQGLVFAHHHGLCHRDIKPSNILVSKLGIVKLVDFGLAKTLEELQRQAPTEPGFAGSGTLSFMSPEQAHGESLDQQTDVFSAGILGHILLYGRHPFNHPSGVTSVFDLIKEPTFECAPPSASSGRPVSDQVSKVLMKMLRKNKAERYGSILEALSDLTRQPVQACSNCGATSPPTSRFCAQCGQLLKVAEVNPKPRPSASASGKTGKTPEQLTDDGFRLAQKGDWEGAIQTYQDAVKLNPKYGLAYTNMGYALNRIGRFNEAIDALSKAANLTSHDAHLCRNYDLRGFSRMNLKDYLGAIADFTTALSHNSEDARVFLHRAQARAQIGELSKSLQDLNKAIRLDPENHQAVRLKRKLEAEGAV
jgi:serine/threonine protein kinase